MTWIVGIIGFAGGFCLGLLIIHFFLRGKSKEDLTQDKSLHWTYGIGVWVFAGLGAWAALKFYALYFS